jgi:16S rRNA (guanine1516-N2)-methyltransferase
MGPIACIVTSSDLGALTTERVTKAKGWGEFLQAPLNPSNPEAFAFQLEVLPDSVRLRDAEKRILAIDFLQDHLNYQRKGLRGKNELLAKALGLVKGTRKVLDLTAGLGIDAVYMTQLNFEVTALERSKLLYILLSEALEKVPSLRAKLAFRWADAGEFLQSANSVQEFDAIYFDPMYPHKKKTALPKQEMIVFRDLVGHDEDAAQVLQLALESKVQRVVVKRPVGAPSLLPGIRHAYEGKVVRYDVYMR